MKASVVKGICSVGLAAACAFGVVGCSGGGTGGVAATVNGVEIAEDDITNNIETMRQSIGLEAEDSWASYLASVGYTPESIREQTIDSFVDQELVRQAAEENGITIESSTIDGYVDQIKQNYDTDEAWQEALSSVGMTEDEYRKSIETTLMSQQIQETVVPSSEPTEEELLEAAQTDAATYDGAKRSSHILFASGDEATAQQVLDQINAGEIDFATAAQQYSTDSSAENGGDVGWDKLTTFVEEYQTALDGLSVGQVSGLVTSQYGIHIIMCTDEFHMPEELTSMDQLPEDIRTTITDQVQSEKDSEAFTTWLDEQREAADIVINDMPSGLPYDVDLTPYQTEDESAESTADGTESAESDSSASAEDDAAATDEATAEGDAAAEGAATE